MDQPVISILGKDIPCHYEMIAVDKLKYLFNNPRVYSSISGEEIPDDPEERQALIETHMMDEPSVKNLMPRIKRDGGLQEPIIVRYDTMEVIEGNSRLTVYRHLKRTEKENSGRWDAIQCLVIGKLTREQQYAYLNQVHVEGKTPWATYEKANLAYVMRAEENLSDDEIMQTLQIGKSELEKRISVIQMMENNKDGDKSHFSHYNVLIRNKVIKEELEGNPSLESALLKKIAEKNCEKHHFTSQQLRDKLPTVIGKKRVLNKFVNGKVDLGEAYQDARLSGPHQKLKAALEKIMSVEKADIQSLDLKEVNAALPTIRRLCKECDRTSSP